MKTEKFQGFKFPLGCRVYLPELLYVGFRIFNFRKNLVLYEPQISTQGKESIKKNFFSSISVLTEVSVFGNGPGGPGLDLIPVPSPAPHPLRLLFLRGHNVMAHRAHADLGTLLSRP